MNNQDDHTPLCHATHEQIADELERRYHAFVLAYEEHADSMDEDARPTRISYAGGFNVALGLTERLRAGMRWRVRKAAPWFFDESSTNNPEDDNERSD